jgi:hypothetical protein
MQAERAGVACGAEVRGQEFLESFPSTLLFSNAKELQDRSIEPEDLSFSLTYHDGLWERRKDLFHLLRQQCLALPCPDFHPRKPGKMLPCKTPSPFLFLSHDI